VSLRSTNNKKIIFICFQRNRMWKIYKINSMPFTCLLFIFVNFVGILSISLSLYIYIIVSFFIPGGTPGVHISRLDWPCFHGLKPVPSFCTWTFQVHKSCPDLCTWRFKVHKSGPGCALKVSRCTTWSRFVHLKIWQAKTQYGERMKLLHIWSIHFNKHSI